MRTLCLLTSLPIAVSLPAQALVPTVALPFAPRAVGDVDGDGLDDYAGTLGGSLVVHSGATGAPIAHMTQPAAGLGYYGTGDIDADGHDDVVWLNVTATVLSGADGSVLHTWPQQPSPNGPLDYSTVPGGADFDADGFGDVVLQSGGLHQVRSGRTGQVLYSVTAGDGFLAPSVVLIGDTNGDGYDDLSIALPFASTMNVVHGPDFAVLTGFSFSARPVGDVNCNGATDRLSHPSGTITNVIDGATGAVIGVLPHATGFMPNVAHLRDVDGDGHDDLLVWMQAVIFPPSAAFTDVVSGRTLTVMAGGAGLGASLLGDVDGDGQCEAWASVAGVPTVVEWVDPALPVASRMVKRGSSGTTSIGTRPKIHTRGSCALGQPVFLDVRGTLPSGVSLLLIGDAIDVDLGFLGAPGNRAYTTAGAGLLLLADGHGLAVQSFVMPTTTSLLGATVSVQAAAWDTAANPFGFVTSNAIDIATNN